MSKNAKIDSFKRKGNDANSSLIKNTEWKKFRRNEDFSKYRPLTAS